MAFAASNRPPEPVPLDVDLDSMSIEVVVGRNWLAMSSGCVPLDFFIYLRWWFVGRRGGDVHNGDGQMGCSILFRVVHVLVHWVQTGLSIWNNSEDAGCPMVIGGGVVDDDRSSLRSEWSDEAVD